MVIRFHGTIFLNGLIWIFIIGSFSGCNQQTGNMVSNGKTLFLELTDEQTGINFENKVVQAGENNILNYSYYFNGGGVAIFDINNDGLQDLYFTGNVVENKLYLNKGNLKFEDITLQAGVACGLGWKTGVAVVDINKDGWLDFYVCRSAMGDSLLRKNILFINNKNLTFTESAARYNLDHSGYSTHAAFFDYDRDGDADMFLLNHSLPEYTKFNNLKMNLQAKGDNYASRLLRNDNGKFKDVSDQAGIANNVLSFGLGLAVADVNGDGWLDMYVSNDFNEQDYLYINSKDGTFKNKIKEATGHTSLFSMGSDMADINNDLLPDIITLDMMPHSNERIKLSTGDDNFDKNEVLSQAGLHYQTMRNMLQLNNGDGTFSEIGQLAGISNTDWSWASLFADFDGDKLKDLYISNGYEKDFTNMQFLKFTADAQIKSRQTGEPLDINFVLANIPSIEEGNFLFKNNNLHFSNVTDQWGLGRKFKSNGAAYADLDNDGDPDLVINVMNQNSFIAKNTTVEQQKANFITVDLISGNPGVPVIGTKLIAYTDDSCQYFEFSPCRGFQSSMYSPITIGIGAATSIDSLRIVWPDQKTKIYYSVLNENILKPVATDAIAFYFNATTPAPLFEPVSMLDWTHSVAIVNDFKQQILLPRMYSYSGPRIIKGDINKDGLTDLFVCGPAGQPSSLFVQSSSGKFIETNKEVFSIDKMAQDENAGFLDADGDGDIDLFVVSGSYNVMVSDMQDRLYLNDGKGIFTKSTGAIPTENSCGSVVIPLDIEKDGDIDLFVGNRMVPGKYPVSQSSRILINNGKGIFSDQTISICPELEQVGMVTDALTIDLNKDGMQDLIIVGEWMPVKIFISNGTSLEDKTSSWISWENNGWWSKIKGADFDDDGDVDLVIGNAGDNNQYNVSDPYPVTLVYKDFDNNGQIDPFLCYFIDGISYPYASRDEALGQVGFLRNRFLDYNSYANVILTDLFSSQELSGAKTLKATNLKTVFLENKGSSFSLRSLPVQAQFAPVFAIENADVDKDGDPDLIMAGNETKVRVRLGRSDANKGFVFINDGKANFSYLPQSKAGLDLKDDTRELLLLNVLGQDCLIVGQTGKPILTYKLNQVAQ